MRVILFGSTGMVGQGVLLECLDHPEISAVLTVVRSRAEVNHPKVREILHQDFFDYSGIQAELTGYDACFFCLGVSAAGMTEERYRHLTYDLTVTAASALARLNPRMTFCYISGAGTDSTETGRIMWARVKGATENRLLEMPFKAAYMFRPGYIQPLKGIRSKIRLYQTLYTLFGALYPILWRLAPGLVTTTEKLGLAIIHVGLHGYTRPLIEGRDINTLAEEALTSPASGLRSAAPPNP